MIKRDSIMSIKDIKALTFDTGGTILDWHTGFKNAFKEAILCVGFK